MLETLAVQVEGSTMIQNRLLLNIAIPSLRKLDVRKIVPLWTEPCFKGLTHFTIVTDMAEPTMSQIVVMLQCTPSLEFLKLSRMLPVCAGVEVNCEGIANLERLSYCELHDIEPTTCFHLISGHMSFPSTTDIYISTRRNVDDQDVKDLLQFLLPGALADIDTKFIIDFTCDEYKNTELRLENMDGHSPSIRCMKILANTISKAIGPVFGVLTKLVCVEIVMAPSRHRWNLWSFLYGLPSVSELLIANFSSSSFCELFVALEKPNDDILLSGLRKISIGGFGSVLNHCETVSEAICPALPMRRERGMAIRDLRISGIQSPGGNMFAVGELVDYLDYRPHSVHSWRMTLRNTRDE